MIAVIVPIFNEMNNPYFFKIVERYRCFDFCNLYLIDGGSVDGTTDYLDKLNVPYYRAPSHCRAEQLNFGVVVSREKLLLLHHPRSLLNEEALSHLDSRKDCTWGAFSHSFDHSHALLKFTSWYSNCIRGGVFGIYYLDHCIFVRRDLYEPLPAVEIFEDTILSHHLKKIARPTRLPFRAMTSAIRFIQNGVYRQALVNQALKLCFRLGASHRVMNRIYEAGLGLNNRKM